MKAVRLGCAILATMVALAGMCIGEFKLHRELPRSRQTIEAFRADMANHTAESEALVMQRTQADVEYNDRHESTVKLLTYLPIIVVIWTVWWLAGREKKNQPIF